MKIKEFQHQPVKPDTYEASMALNQLMRIGKHAIKLHNMIDDAAEMESWVAKKIDLAGDYVKKVYNYTEGEKAGLYDDGGLTEDAGEQALANELSKYYQDSADGYDPEDKGNDEHEEAEYIAREFKKGLQAGMDAVNISSFEFSSNDFDVGKDGRGEVHYQMADLLKKYGVSAGINKKSESYLIKDGKAITDPGHWNKRFEGMAEDAGEGHMSKSTLYHTAKYAIALMDMIKPGDDLEGWVQSKLNKAADYLQGVYNYEEYQKLNPYREELDSKLMQKHAQVVQKNIDEILAKETKIDDIDTKPGMMRILAKRVNEVEKEIAKETRKQSETQTDESGILYRAGVKKYGKAGMKAIQSAAGKGASHQEIGKIKDKHLKDAEDLEEGLKDWAKKTAMAGVIVAGLAGVNSINNAIDNSIPAINAMNTALEMAQDSGNDELAKMIEKDLSDAKIRLNSGKDLSYVVDLQNKYAKFIKSESLAYESKLGLMLNQQLK